MPLNFQSALRDNLLEVGKVDGDDASPEAATKRKTVDNMVGILTAFLKKAGIDNLDNLDNLDDLKATFPDIEEKNLIKNLKVLLETLFPGGRLTAVINGVNAEKYTADYLVFLSERGNSIVCNQVLAAKHPNPKADLISYVNNINDLFILEKSGMKLADLQVNNYLHDLLTISNGLRDNSAFDAAMKKLDSELIAYAKRVGAELNADGTNLSSENLSKQHVLSGFFAEWAEKNGFGNTTAKLHGKLTDNDFFKVLQNKVLFKDIGAPIAHGPWSHFSQIYYIAQLDLKNPIAAIYQALGESRSQGNKNVFESWEARATTTFNVWDHLFDRADPSNTGDMRSARNVTERMTRYDAVKTSIVGQSMKRAMDNAYVRNENARLGVGHVKEKQKPLPPVNPVVRDLLDSGDWKLRAKEEEERRHVIQMREQKMRDRANQAVTFLTRTPVSTSSVTPEVTPEKLKVKSAESEQIPAEGMRVGRK